MSNFQQIAKDLVSSIKSHVDKKIDAITARFAEIDKKIEEHFKAVGLETTQILVELEEMDEKIKQRVSDALAEIPPAKDGKDADPDEIRSMVEHAVAQIPAPKDGESVDMEALEAMIQQKVDALPKPADGKSVEIDEVKQIIEEIFAKIEMPKDGESVTLEDVQPLIAEAVKTAVDALPKPKDGKDADYEEIKRMVEEAVSALPRAKDGEDGKDAAHLEILPEIDLGKSYKRNTYARHNGGLWRSFEKTSGMKGWECLANGIAKIEFVESEDRGFMIRIEKSSEEVTEYTLPVPTYKKVFKRGQKYFKGDFVTWGGSIWHCDADETEEMPATASKQWTLAVKAGRDKK